MYILLIVIHLMAAVLLTLIILLQHSSGGGLSGMFGGGGGMEDMLSSPSGDVFLRKVTITLVVIFFCTSLILAVRTANRSSRSLLERTPVRMPIPSSETAPKSTPAEPALP